jgi:hypothetical protein
VSRSCSRWNWRIRTAPIQAFRREEVCTSGVAAAALQRDAQRPRVGLVFTDKVVGGQVDQVPYADLVEEDVDGVGVEVAGVVGAGLLAPGKGQTDIGVGQRLDARAVGEVQHRAHARGIVVGTGEKGVQSTWRQRARARSWTRAAARPTE